MRSTKWRDGSGRPVLLAALVVVPLLALVAFAVGRVASSEGRNVTSSDILNPHPAAGPFSADGTTLDDCAADDDPRRCFEQAFGNIAYRTSGKRALALVAERQQTDAEVDAGCHRIVHAIGAAVLAREDGDTGAALVDGDSTCWSGFYPPRSSAP